MINVLASMNAFIVYRCWVLNADLKETFAHLSKRNERNQHVRPLRARTERQKFCLRLVVNNIKESASTFHAQGLIDIFVAVKSQVLLRKFELLSASCANLTGMRLESAVTRPKLFQSPNLSSTE